MHGTRSRKKDQLPVEGAPLAPPTDVVLPPTPEAPAALPKSKKTLKKIIPKASTEAAATQAFWTQADEAAFVAYVHANKSQAGDGANFSKEFWNGVAQEMTKHTTRGKAKTGDACKQKWACDVRSCPWNPWSC